MNNQVFVSLTRFYFVKFRLAIKSRILYENIEPDF
jgi:hypothetical protein